MGVEAIESFGNYLGLPAVIGRSKKVIFSNLQDKLWKKIKGWKEKVLSQTGKEILLKYVAQAIPNYVMSCFKIPSSYCMKLESMMNGFWWGGGDNSRKIQWVAWDTLCKSKKDGGLGFRNLQSFNDALLGKLEIN